MDLRIRFVKYRCEGEHVQRTRVSLCSIGGTFVVPLRCHSRMYYPKGRDWHGGEIGEMSYTDRRWETS